MFSVLGEKGTDLLHIMLLGEIDRLVPLVQLDARVNGTLDLVRLRNDTFTSVIVVTKIKALSSNTNYS